jgi:hypothetical protein
VSEPEGFAGFLQRENGKRTVLRIDSTNLDGLPLPLCQHSLP